MEQPQNSIFPWEAWLREDKMGFPVMELGKKEEFQDGASPTWDILDSIVLFLVSLIFICTIHIVIKPYSHNKGVFVLSN